MITWSTTIENTALCVQWRQERRNRHVTETAQIYFLDKKRQEILQGINGSYCSVTFCSIKLI
jgi:hypothetical protein